MFIAPSAAAIPLGKANLVVGPLVHKGKFYVGKYQLKIEPYFFKSEKGTLKLEASDDDVRKLTSGIAVPFKGKAINNADGKPKMIIGTVTPSATDRGNVSFSVTTDNGPVVFNTSYHLGS